MNTVTKRISYNRDTRDYDCYVAIDGDAEQYVGSAASYHAGEVKCHQHVMDYYEIAHTPEQVARLVLATMNRYDSMQSYARYIREHQAKLDELNRDYWKQDRDERIRRDVVKGGEIAARSFAAGALSVLIDLHIEDADSYIPFDDQLGEEDVIEAVRRATSDEKDTGYWEYITRGGALGYAAWLRYEAERAALYATPEDDITNDQWKRLHALDCALGY